MLCRQALALGCYRQAWTDASATADLDAVLQDINNALSTLSIS